MKHPLLVLGLAVVAAGCARAPQPAPSETRAQPSPALTALVPAAVPAVEIPAYQRLTPNLAIAGQPSPSALSRLSELGFRTVVNLRTEKEGALEERAVVEGQGLRYAHVPVTAETLTAADVAAVQAVLEEAAAQPILLHCASSNRVGAVLAAIEAARGRRPEEALAVGRAAGLQSPSMVAAVTRLMAERTAGAPVVKP